MAGFYPGHVTSAQAETVVSADEQAKTKTADNVISTQPPPGFEHLMPANQAVTPTPPQPSDNTITTTPPPGFEHLDPTNATSPASGSDAITTIPPAGFPGAPVPDNGTAIVMQPPAGFEESVEPEETNIDLFYGGVKLGSYPARYDLNHVTFQDPPTIIAKIPHLKTDAKPPLEEALRHPLDTNIAAHCPKEIISQKTVCGTLSPDTLAVIFYADNFKADLFINPSYLELQDTRLGIKLPRAEKVISGVHSFNGTVNSTNGTDNNFSLLQNSILSYGEARVNFSSVLNQDQSTLNSAAFGLDRGGYLSRVGFFDTGHFQVIPQTRLAGLSIETSFDTNMDLKQTMGNQLTIYLPKRAWVTLMRDKTTYSSDFYEAGNQIIDTSQLPDGAYELTLQINEGNGDTREEKRFYAKNFNIPPDTTPVYYLQAGMMRDDKTLSTVPTVTDQSVIVAGTTRRLTASTGANIGLMNTDDNTFLESSFFALFPRNNQLSIGGLVSRLGDYGTSISFIGSAFQDRLGYAANVRQIWAANPQTTGLTPSVSTSPVAYNPTDAWQASSTLSYQLFSNLSVNMQYNESANGALTKTRSYGPYVRWNVWQKNQASVMFFADANHSDTADTASAYVRFSYQFGKWGISTNTGARYNKAAAMPGGSNGSSGSGGGSGATGNEDGTQPYGNGRLAWSDTEKPGRTINGGIEFNMDQGTQSKRADMDYRDELGRLKLDVAQNTNNGIDTTTGIGSFGFNVLHGGAHMAAGGAREERSGFIVHADETDDKQKAIAAQVSVNGSPAGVVEPGSTLPILLSPYQTYQVSAEPVNSNIPVEVDVKTRDITLYPGNVSPISLDIRRIYIVIGRLVDEHGKPIANARLKRARGLVITDDEGNFQAEVTDPTHMVFTYLPGERPALAETPAITAAPNITSDVVGPYGPLQPHTPPSDDMYQPTAAYNDAVDTDPPPPVKAVILSTIPFGPPTPVSVASQLVAPRPVAHLSDVPFGPPAPQPAVASPAIATVAAERTSDSNANVRPDPLLAQAASDTASSPSAAATAAEATTETPDDPTRVVPENTPQWVRDAAKAANPRLADTPRVHCTVKTTGFHEKNGIVIYKDALACLPTSQAPEPVQY